VVNTGTFTVDNSNNINISEQLTGGGTFQNNGTLDQAGGNLGLFGDGHGLTFNNAAGAVYNFQSASFLDEGSGGGQFINAGTIEMTGGTNTAFFSSSRKASSQDEGTFRKRRERD
jgi:hypothetical protein